MAAIKEYPFDLSDLKNQPSGQSRLEVQQSVSSPTEITLPTQSLQSSSLATGADGKRKVSIMADESSKDRENLPSER